jgi:hypothetical protein
MLLLRLSQLFFAKTVIAISRLLLSVSPERRDYCNHRDYAYTKYIAITLGVLKKRVSAKHFRKQEWSFRLFRCFSEGRRGDRGP